MSSVTIERSSASGEMDLLVKRRIRMEELWRSGGLEASRYFAMRFFHGIESAVKARCADARARQGYDFVRDSLRGRTLARGHTYLRAEESGRVMPKLGESEWEARGLGLPREAVAGFARLVESAAATAALDAGVDVVAEIGAAFLRFVRLEASVRQQAMPSQAVGTSLGGEPDSAHFFSFSELALAQLEVEPGSEFWLAVARGAIAAQPIFLAIHLLAARRAPRSVVDYGPGDVLHRPFELDRRLAAVPAVDDLTFAAPAALAERVARNARVGLIGVGPEGRVNRPSIRPRRPRPRLLATLSSPAVGSAPAATG